MNNTKGIKRDELIRDSLISSNIIQSERVSKCGTYRNKVTRLYEDSIRPVKYFCGSDSCRPCRTKKIERRLKRNKIHNDEFRDNDGRLLMFTLTVPHTTSDSLPFLHYRFKKSLSEMKTGHHWRKLKRITDHIYNYDNIELTQTNNGYHLHNHIIWGCMNWDVSTKEIKNDLFNTWSHYTRKNDLKRLSRLSMDVTEDPYEELPKSVSNSSEINGTLDNLEVVCFNYLTDPNYSHPTKTQEDVDYEYQLLSSVFRGSRSGRINR